MEPYYSGFGDQITGLFDDVMSVVLSLESDQNVITGLYRVEAWWSKDIPRIAEAEEIIKRDFWKYEYVRIGGDSRWGLDECKKYGTFSIGYKDIDFNNRSLRIYSFDTSLFSTLPDINPDNMYLGLPQIKALIAVFL